MYPNICCIFYDKEYFFHSNEIYDKLGVYNPEYIRKIKKILNLKKDKNSCIVILNCIYPYYHEVIKVLKEHKVKKVYFFIDDFFRIRNKNQNIGVTETHTIESDFKNTVFKELEIIYDIINLSEINNFKIYHCEKIPKKYQKKFGFNIHYFDLYLSNWCNYNKDKKLKNIIFDYKVSCMNHRADWHRELMAALLKDNPDAFVTFFNKMPNNKNPFIKTETFDKEFQELIKLKLKNFKQSPNQFLDENGRIVTSHSNKSIIGKIQNSEHVLQTINNSFLNVVTETRYASPFQYVSEKSLKPMLCHRPFVILGTPHTLEILKTMGFKTFDNWWDESYDKEIDHSKRFKMVYDIISKILITDNDKLQKMLYEMKPVLAHNAKVISNIPKFFLKNLSNTSSLEAHI